jgi:Lar family restriction alleviation protein
MAELKSCPFCGGEAEYRPAGGLSETNGYVRCKNFCCEQHWYSPKKEAIEAWNRRAEDANQTKT